MARNQGLNALSLSLSKKTQPALKQLKFSFIPSATEGLGRSHLIGAGLSFKKALGLNLSISQQLDVLQETIPLTKIKFRKESEDWNWLHFTTELVINLDSKRE